MRKKARCDYGLHLGAGTDNVETAYQLAPQVTGLKMYLDQTFGPLRLDIAKAILKQHGDDTKLFSFNVGTSF